MTNLAATRNRLRMERATTLALALGEAHPADASAIAAAYLHAMQTDGPTMGDPFGMVASDARFWADCAPPHELAAYGLAALEKLRGSALGIGQRKRLFAALWASFSEADRVAFLRRVDADGRFHGRAA